LHDEKRPDVMLGHEPDSFQHGLFGLDGVDRSTFAVEQVTHGNHAFSLPIAQVR
jgi:hypothetical protein